MNKLIFFVLILSILAGQVIKIPVGNFGGIILLDVAVIFLCFLGIYNIKFRLKRPPVFIKAALVFIAICLISLLFTPIKLTFPEFIISLLYTIRYSAYILVGWLIYQGAFPSFKKAALNVLITSGVFLAILGLLQLIFLKDLQFLAKYGWDPHYFRTVSTFFDPNFVGAYFVLTLLLLSLSRNKMTSFVWILVYLALLTTFSRGAYLAFFTSFTLISILNRSKKQILFTIILSLGLLLGFNQYKTYVAAPRGIDRYESATSRQDSWRQGWQLFLNSPILGVGFNTYRFALRQYDLADEKFLKSHGSSTNDSSLLYVAATTGILGLTAYLIFLLSLALGKHKVLTSGLIGLIAQSFFANTLFYPPLLFWVILVAYWEEDKTSS